MYNTILLAVPLQAGGEKNPHVLAARDAAIAVAAGGGKSVTVLTVYDLERIDGHHELIPTIDEIDPGRSVEEKARQRRQLERIEKTEEEVRSAMAHFVVEFHNHGISTNQIIKEGNPRELISETAGEIGADLIIIGAHARRSILDVVLGGTAQAVANKAPCTVIMVKPKH